MIWMAVGAGQGEQGQDLAAGVRDEVVPHDAPRSQSGALGRLHELRLRKRQQHAAYLSQVQREVHHGDGQDQDGHPVVHRAEDLEGAEGGEHGEPEQEDREGLEHLDNPQGHHVDPPPAVSGPGARQTTQPATQGNPDEGQGEVDPGSHQHPREDVEAQGVRPEPMLSRRGDTGLNGSGRSGS